MKRTLFALLAAGTITLAGCSGDSNSTAQAHDEMEMPAEPKVDSAQLQAEIERLQAKLADASEEERAQLEEQLEKLEKQAAAAMEDAEEAMEDAKEDAANALNSLTGDN